LSLEKINVQEGLGAELIDHRISVSGMLVIIIYRFSFRETEVYLLNIETDIISMKSSNLLVCGDTEQHSLVDGYLSDQQ
jgi:hypothetical protein